MPDLANNPHWLAVAAFYGELEAERSGRPYLDHIREGVRLLELMQAPQAARDAFCLHPLVQGDGALRTSISEISFLRRFAVDPVAVALAVEYRAVANRYLSKMVLREADAIEIGPLEEVHQMLVADKVQNRKDFEKYNRDHERAEHLHLYFSAWLKALGVSEARYRYFVKHLEDDPPLEELAEPGAGGSQ